MKTMSQQAFLQTLPDVLIPHLPLKLQSIQVRQPWRWIIQFHFGEARLHYELSRVARREAWEIGFHFESGDKQLNRFLLKGFRRHLFEIKETLGESFEAEMWDKGWTKIYEVVPAEGYTDVHQRQIGKRMAEVIICLHPIFVDLRSQAAQLKR
ncbi:MAG: hypothetical protein H6654_13970 [Ardenticatenaceae bacterium]|nr:hypothetical protein [Anaerolineales bacterium]MCB8974663.1 hypothetical protein [Ardenticatenaceae bacterium]